MRNWNTLLNCSIKFFFGWKRKSFSWWLFHWQFERVSWLGSIETSQTSLVQSHQSAAKTLLPSTRFNYRISPLTLHTSQEENFSFARIDNNSTLIWLQRNSSSHSWNFCHRLSWWKGARALKQQFSFILSHHSWLSLLSMTATTKTGDVIEHNENINSLSQREREREGKNQWREEKQWKKSCKKIFSWFSDECEKEREKGK